MEHAIQNEPPPQHTSPEKTNAMLRELKKGDLVRVSERKQSGQKTRGGLGRVLTDEGNDKYHVEWVLGGRAFLDRHDLQYTTADAEGLTMKADRRKRKPKLLEEEVSSLPPLKKKQKTTKKKGTAAKKKTVKGSNAKKGVVAKKSAAAASTKKTASTAKKSAPKKSALKKTTTSAPKKTTASKKRKAAASTPPPEEETSTTTTTSNATDLYNRHLREFERMVDRLQKIDRYGFFLGEPPAEFQEVHQVVVATKAAPDETANLNNDARNDIPARSVVYKFPSTPPFNWTVVRQRMEHGRYVLDRIQQEVDTRKRLYNVDTSSSTTVQQQNYHLKRPNILHPLGVNWDVFNEDICGMCRAAMDRDLTGSNATGTLRNAASKILEAMQQMYQRTGQRHLAEMKKQDAIHKFSNLLLNGDNTEAALQGKWRTQPFPARHYERLTAHNNQVCAGLSKLDQVSAIYELQTSIQDSFVGLSYKFQDVGQSEGWMKSVVVDLTNSTKRKRINQEEAAKALEADDGVVRAQVRATMQTMLIAVQDRVMTESGVLHSNELNAENNTQNQELTEHPVWGIDCYTRRNITMCLETEFTPSVAIEFIEKWLLPAINASPAHLAHNITNAAKLLQGQRLDDSLLGKALENKMSRSGPPWLKAAARELELAHNAMGHDFFRVHPKGHGSVVLCSEGLKANSLVTFYRGEVYPPWRWSEKMDAIEMTQQKLGLRPELPDFYNMALERPQVDPRGYGMLFVDASRKAGHGSMISHSCQPTCEVRVSAVHGQLCLAMTTLRDIEQGEELTFDYNAVTESLNEYRAAVCLCGNRKCRGSFLHFATADCYQQVLSRNSPIASRLSDLIKGCMKKVMAQDDLKVLQSHGFGTAAFGAVGFTGQEEPLDSMDYVPIWLRTFVADTLRYIEYERRALPIALLCNELTTTTSTSTSQDVEKKPKKKPKGVKTEKKPCADKPAVDKPKSATTNDKDSKPIPGCKPVPVFLYFAKKKREFFEAVLREQGMPTDVKGLKLSRALLKVAGSSWNALSDDRKNYWRQESVKEWEEAGGKQKAKLEEERLRRIGEKAKEVASAKEASTEANKDTTSEETISKPKKRKRSSKSKDNDSQVCPSKISFEAADAEGLSAMEQRIQQLTQTLSRVGRVLYRHRESSLETDLQRSPLRSKIHSPISILPDENVVGWIWNDENGVVRTLLRYLEEEKCVSPSLRNSIRQTEQRNSSLRRYRKVGPPLESGGRPLLPAKARLSLKKALLRFRTLILKELKQMEADLKRHKYAKARRKAQMKREKKKKTKAVQKPPSENPCGPFELGDNDAGRVSYVVRSALHDIVDHVATESAKGASSLEKEKEDDVEKVVANVVKNMVESVATKAEKLRKSKSKTIKVPELGPWMEHYDERGRLAAVADVLLMYAHTSTFFALEPYVAFDSTPIEVYARELGNAVPKSTVEVAKKYKNDSADGVVLVASEHVDKASNGLPNSDSTGLPAEATVQEKQAESSNGRELDPPAESNQVDITISSSIEGEKMESSATQGAVHEPRTEETGEVAGTIAVESTPEDKSIDLESRSVNTSGDLSVAEDELVVGARFSVTREGKDKYQAAVVIETDVDGEVPKVKFHFLKMKSKFDEWIEIGSSRISRLPQGSQHRLLQSKASSQHEQANSDVLSDDELELAESSIDICQPDDVITNVVVKYRGDYVVSQLLQWYNGGIGQKPGMPDLIGCAMLPPISGCFKSDELKSTSQEENAAGEEKTHYETSIRPKLKEWFQDAQKRGSPWPDVLQSAFAPSNDATPADDSQDSSVLMGSPILDLLVSADFDNIQQIVLSLTEQMSLAEGVDEDADGVKRMSTAERLQSTVDVGRPAQAIANWVQCENPDCLKWRKLPWHVDIDVLPEKFFCKDNIWNPEANSCNAPADTWEDNKDGKLKKSPEKARKKKDPAAKKAKKIVPEAPPVKTPTVPNTIDKANFILGARFRIYRFDRMGKPQYHIGKVVSIDTTAEVLRLKFHYSKLQDKFDEWIEADSPRISVYTKPPRKERPMEVSKPKKTEASKVLVLAPTQKEKAKKDTTKAAPIETPTVPNGIDNATFVLGTRFSIFRLDRTGRPQYLTGKVVATDTSSDVLRVKFHYSKLQDKFDEWIQADSPRIALYKKPPPKQKSASSAKPKMTANTDSSSSQDRTQLSNFDKLHAQELLLDQVRSPIRATQLPSAAKTETSWDDLGRSTTEESTQKQNDWSVTRALLSKYASNSKGLMPTDEVETRRKEKVTIEGSHYGQQRNDLAMSRPSPGFDEVQSMTASSINRRSPAPQDMSSVAAAFLPPTGSSRRPDPQQLLWYSTQRGQQQAPYLSGLNMDSRDSNFPSVSPLKVSGRSQHQTQMQQGNHNASNQGPSTWNGKEIVGQQDSRQATNPVTTFSPFSQYPPSHKRYFK